MSKKEFEEGKDYHLVDGRIIFTSTYLLSRGSCCGGSCELCPYTEKVKNNKEVKK